MSLSAASISGSTCICGTATACAPSRRSTRRRRSIRWGTARSTPSASRAACYSKPGPPGFAAFAHTRVANVEIESGRFVLVTERGRITARAVVYAAGYESGQFLPHDVGALHSTYAVASTPLAECHGWPDGCLIWETARPYFYAGRPATAGPSSAGKIPRIPTTTRTNRWSAKSAAACRAVRPALPGNRLRSRVRVGRHLRRNKRRPGLHRQPARARPRVFRLRLRGQRHYVQPDRRPLDRRPFFGRPNDDAAVFRFGR